MAKWYQEVLTFGAAGRVEDAAEDYRDLCEEAAKLHEHVEKKRAKAEQTMRQLVEAKIDALRSLRKIRRISKNLSARERDFREFGADDRVPPISLEKVENTLKAGEMAMAAAKGTAAGVSGALGAWALAANFGAASTGTAISSLSGVAATNATLAWFGGGSLAAGGAGTAGGAMVLGGVVAIPALAVAAILAHAKANKKIAQIERQSAKVEDAIDSLKKMELVVSIADRRARELNAAVGKAREAFEHEFEAAWARLFRLGWISQAWRWLRSLFIREYYSQAELSQIQQLLLVGESFAKILDQRVFTEDGCVQKGKE